jgi:formylglycine-generating enzyme required for sulfatase activity
VALPVQVDPADARLDVHGSPAWQTGASLIVLPGERRLTASREGYAPRELVVDARRDAPPLRIALDPLPGRLRIDTHGVTAEVHVDGALAGTAPGEVEVDAGARTLLVRAPGHLDFVRRVRVAGAGRLESLDAPLVPNRGRVAISSVPEGAELLVDGEPRGRTPLTVELDAGIRELALAAPERSTWRSRVAVTAGAELALGPIDLGAPEGAMRVVSTPAGAAITVDGRFAGTTPLTVRLAAGAPHQVDVSLAGHAPWRQSLTLDPGRTVAVRAALEPVLVALTVSGEPADARVQIDDRAAELAPFTARLPARGYRVRVTRDGYQPFETTVQLGSGQESAIRYALMRAGEGGGSPLPPRIEGRLGGTLVLVPAGSFRQGSERREQGRRANEPARRVRITRPFYLGADEVTNARYLKFRPQHRAGFAGQHTLELDAHPVTGVSWNDAVEFCNWLSEQEGLPPAYEPRGGTYVLRQPATTGYRLPSEAEWEYATRRVDAQRSRRFGWGDALPPPAGAGNIAGDETVEKRTADASYPGYRDDHPALAPTGAYGGTPTGFNDVVGNASEWTGDVYLSLLPAGEVDDPLATEGASTHTIKGSSWRSATVSELRLAWREGAAAGSNAIGFRLARSAPPDERQEGP